MPRISRKFIQGTSKECCSVIDNSNNIIDIIIIITVKIIIIIIINIIIVLSKKKLCDTVFIMHSEQAVGKLNCQRKRLSKTTIFFGNGQQICPSLF